MDKTEIKKWTNLKNLSIVMRLLEGFLKKDIIYSEFLLYLVSSTIS